MQTLALRAHDLVWVGGPHTLIWRLPSNRLREHQGKNAVPETMPDWLSEWLSAGATTPAVVRREHTGNTGLLPIGIRGAQRHQRRAAYVADNSVLRVVRPEDLIYKRKGNDDALCNLQSVLLAIAPAMNAVGLPWGPTGGLGFALATGLPVVHQRSDLDLVLRARQALSIEQAQALKRVIEQSPRVIDLQIDTGRAGFSFTEWEANMQAAGQHGGKHAATISKRSNGARSARTLLKTDSGPMLVADPWARPLRALAGQA